MRRLAIVSILLLTAGCSSEESLRAPGPTPLRGTQHMEDYLPSASAWKLWYRDDPVQFWNFDQDGTFTAWTEGESELGLEGLFPDQINSETTRLTGKWRATTTRLQLSEIIGTEGEAVEPFTLDLRWIDGKLRIEIGGHHYMRQME